MFASTQGADQVASAFAKAAVKNAAYKQVGHVVFFAPGAGSQQAVAGVVKVAGGEAKLVSAQG